MSLTPDQRKQARFIIRRYLEQAEANKSKIHYSQFRPITCLGDPPSHGFTTDCSGLTVASYYWADLWCPFKVKDPSGAPWADGWTGSLLETNIKRRVPPDHRYFIADMAIYGSSLSNTKHVTVCRQGGELMDSIWTSHGSELGPYPTRLNYRPDLLVVVRSESLA